MIVFQVFLAIVVIGFAIVAPILWVTLSVDYSYHASKEDVRMKYKEFLDIYYVNKNKIKYYDSMKRVKYDIGAIEGRRFANKSVNIKFNFIDWLRICHFFKTETKRAAKINNLAIQKENLKLILDSVQGDIDRIRKQSEEEVNHAREVTYSKYLARDTYQNTIN